MPAGRLIFRTRFSGKSFEQNAVLPHVRLLFFGTFPLDIFGGSATTPHMRTLSRTCFGKADAAVNNDLPTDTLFYEPSEIAQTTQRPLGRSELLTRQRCGPIHRFIGINLQSERPAGQPFSIHGGSKPGRSDLSSVPQTSHLERTRSIPRPCSAHASMRALSTRDADSHRSDSSLT